MSKTHYLVTCRSVRKVTVPGLQDQYWYEHAENTSADIAVPHMHCGKYVEVNGMADRPFFYSPAGETAWTTHKRIARCRTGFKLISLSLLSNDAKKSLNQLVTSIY